AGDLSLELREVPRKVMLDGTPFDLMHSPSIRNAELYTVANDVQFRFMDVPFFYARHVEGDARDPLGPLEDVRLKFDHVYGAGLMVRLDLFQLLGLEKPPDTRWDI